MEFDKANVSIGNKIRSYRLKKKWMQSDLAKRIGVKGNSVSAYERGSVEIPLSKLKLIAEVLEVKYTDLIPVDNTEETLSDYIQEAKAELDEDQLKFLEGLISKTLSLNSSERANFLSNLGLAVDFYNKK